MGIRKSAQLNTEPSHIYKPANSCTSAHLLRMTTGSAVLGLTTCDRSLLEQTSAAA